LRPRAALEYRNHLSSPQFKLISRRGVTWLESTRLASIPWLVHAWSTRQGGISRTRGSAADLLPGLNLGLNLGFIPSDSPTRVERNRVRFLQALGAETFVLATLHQVHSAHAFEVRAAKDQLEYVPAGGKPGSAGVPSAFQHDCRGPSHAGGGLSQTTQPGSGAPRAPSGDGCAGDALLSHESGVLLSVRVADCMPILMVDPRLRAVAAVHAGWRGAAKRIVEKSVGEMRRVFGSQPRDILAAVGPSIRACCYEVGEEVVDAFGSRFAQSDGYFREASPRRQVQAAKAKPFLPLVTAQPSGSAPSRRSGRASTIAGEAAVHLDLLAVARDQLRVAGVPARNIEVADYCTCCRTDLFFSHRKEGPTGRAMAVIGIRLD